MNPPAERPSPDVVHKIVDWAINKERMINESKFSSVDIRIDSLGNELSRLPGQIDKMVKSLEDVVGARLANIMTEVMHIKATITNVETTGRSLDDKTDTLRDRLTTIESRTMENRATVQDNSARLYSSIAIIVSLAIGAGTIWTGLQHNDSDRVMNENVNRLQTEHDVLQGKVAHTPVEKSDMDLLSQRLDALSRRMNSIPNGPSILGPVLPGDIR